MIDQWIKSSNYLFIYVPSQATLSPADFPHSISITSPVMMGFLLPLGQNMMNFDSDHATCHSLHAMQWDMADVEKWKLFCFTYTNAAPRFSFCNWWRLTAKALRGVPSWLGVSSWGLRDHYLISWESELLEAVEEREKTAFINYSLLNKSSYFQRGQNVILSFRELVVSLLKELPC